MSINAVGRDELLHSPQAIAARLSAGPRHSYLRDWVYGGIDGAVTTFAVVAGVVGAQLAPPTIVILGMANLVADGFSMAASNYLGTKTEQEQLRHFSKIEHEEIRRFPEGEREEVRQILSRKGFKGNLLEKSVEMLTSDRERWVQLMLTEEYGLPLVVRSPWRAALATFSAFCLCGLIPLLPFLFGVSNGFAIASALTGVVFFGIGSLKGKWTISKWWHSGAITFLIGAGASVLAYLVGLMLKVVVS